MPLVPRIFRAAIVLLLGSLAPSALAAQPIRVHGRLVTPNGIEGVPGAAVELVPRFETLAQASARLAGKPGPVPLALVRTEAGGFFRIDAPWSGLYSVVVRAEGYRPLEHPLALVEETDLPPAVMAPASAPPAQQMSEDWRPFRAEGERVRVIGLEPSRLVAGRVVDAGTGAAIPGALVWSPEAALTPPVLSGADGTFKLRLPVRFRREVRAAAPGRFPAGAEVPAGGTAAPVTLALAPAAVIAGSVVDEQGGAVAGCFLASTDGTDAEKPPRLGWSRPDGSFRLASLLPARRYTVMAAQEGFAPGNAEVTTAPAGKTAPPLRIVLTRGQRAFGRVVDEEGRPVAGVMLTLEPAFEDEPLPLEEIEGTEETGFSVVVLEGSSDAQGAFEIPGVSAGTFTLRAMREGFAAFSKEGIEIAAAPAATDLGTITLEHGVAIEGRVTDSKGHPIEGAQVTATPFVPLGAVGSFDVTSQQPEETGADGSFRIGTLKRGERYDLSVRHRGHVPTTAPGVEAPAGDVRIVLQTARTLSGRVVGPGREPVPGAEIAATEETKASFEGSGYEFTSTRPLAVTDAEGRFSIADLEAGTLNLVVSARKYRTRRLEGFRMPDEDVDSLEIVLDRGARLEGRVIDGEGEPVVRARLEARLQGGEGFSDPDSQPLTVSGEDGSYVLQGLETAQYQIVVESPTHGRT
ncbi:MAG TPA: carboxypeptidase regulatory-like domain-containing protein, partial [Thermoanaerobaculia bacterium]|nr:carboxypeptidase regulatory-like domain-containing protein [Thermoanaerobaculia bacterium]